ncbi:DUF983 domain-containing protein [Caulobacter sp. NIBR1757]|uniref:DUF983 domain-containing protein n=1 Tax=Caulobacter sp. NIBR1757 TaxID=3016000 RepID=UPI0022F03444|nr:DUF983 domain-containing protein [Caulobacter sp. NIBR1757]
MSNTSDVRRPVGLGIKRGLKHRCPNCGEGELFARYLKVNAECAACGHDLSQYRADDGPAYLTILLVGHLIVAPAFFFPVMWETSPWIIVPAALAALTAAVLTLLPRIKGGFIGLLWANRVTKDQPA